MRSSSLEVGVGCRPSPPRSHWRLARILSVHRSGDELIRTTRVQTADQSVYERAVQKLIFLFRPEI